MWILEWRESCDEISSNLLISNQQLSMEDDGLLGEFGDFDIDTSVADARAARIAAARDQAKLYSAKIEEPGVSSFFLTRERMKLIDGSEIVVPRSERGSTTEGT
jgi:hypothetical protein